MTKKELFQWLSLCALMTPQTYAQHLKIIEAHMPERQAETSPEKININQATLEQLVGLPGIGEKRAQAIMAARQSKPFTSIAQLVRVKGIGRKQMTQLKDRVTIH